MSYEVPPLPWAKDALEPAISARTVDFHYEKHHKGYAEKLRKQLEDTRGGERSLEELIHSADGSLFNNAAQVWNHTFYWRSLAPGGGGKPDGMMLDVLENSFGSYESFARELAEAANGEFGSGWAWLVKDRHGRLRVQSSDDAENPLQHGYVPLLTIDVWEHAYYLDYQNQRDRYVEGVIDRLLNWDFVIENLKLDLDAGQEDENEDDENAEQPGQDVQGEGNGSADRRYRRATRDFAESGPVDGKAREAADEVS